MQGITKLDESSRLKFQDGNAKLERRIKTFSLPAGYSCPGANLCKSRVDVTTRRIIDGPKCEHRCFAATLEVAFKPSFDAHWHNMELLKQCRTQERMTQLLLDSVKPKAEMIRVHASGDFFNQIYFDAWMAFAVERPDTVCYAYTKSLPFWVNRLDGIPENFVLTASYGGVHDNLIEKFELRHAVVVFHPEEAKKRGLEIDHDDSHAYTRGVDSFALLLHGVQPVNSPAAAALKRMRAENITYSYAH